MCLPTGLGKTLIAAVVMKNFHRWFPRGKVVFLAPTRPLVEQQKAACRDICGMPSEETCVLMGSTKRDLDGTRRTLWRDKRLFFCTPQTMENDLRDGVCPAHDVVCLVIDEAHRAKGNHAYCGVVKQLWDRDVQFRTLALAATPATTWLRCSRWCARSPSGASTSAATRTRTCASTRTSARCDWRR